MKRKLRKVFMSLVAIMSVFVTTCFADMITYSQEEVALSGIIYIVGLLFVGWIVIAIVAIFALILIKCARKRDEEKKQSRTSEIDKMF